MLKLKLKQQTRKLEILLDQIKAASYRLGEFYWSSIPVVDPNNASVSYRKRISGQPPVIIFNCASSECEKALMILLQTFEKDVRIAMNRKISDGKDRWSGIHHTHCISLKDTPDGIWYEGYEVDHYESQCQSFWVSVVNSWNNVHNRELFSILDLPDKQIYRSPDVY